VIIESVETDAPLKPLIWYYRTLIITPYGILPLLSLALVKVLAPKQPEDSLPSFW
jgi:hypothetical protein